MPTFNTLYSNTMQGADQNPFDPTNWTPINNDTSRDMQILDQQGVQADPSGFADILFINSASLTDDHWISFTINSAVSGTSFFSCGVRFKPGPGEKGYLLSFAYGGGFTSYSLDDATTGGTIASGGFSLSLGSTLKLAAQGSSVSILLNDAVVTSVINTSTPGGGTTLFELSKAVVVSDTGIVNLQVGDITYSISGNAGTADATVTYTGPSSGVVVADENGDFSIPALVKGTYTITPSLSGKGFLPNNQVVAVSPTDATNVNFTTASPTPQAIVIGKFSGTSVQNAFPQNNNKMLDLMQIKNSSGGVVWKLNYQGIVTVNATSWTNGTILGQFPGASFQAAIMQDDANPYQLDLIQVFEPGGNCVWFLDYTGTAYAIT